MSVIAPPRATTGTQGRPLDPPLGPSDSGGGSNEWSLLTVAGNQVIAHLISGLLVEEGIEVTLDTSNPSPGAWLHPFGDPNAPVRVMVRRFDLSLARALIHPHQPTGSGAAAPSENRATWSPRLAVTLVVATALLLAFVEVIGFAPCFLRLFCF